MDVRKAACSLINALESEVEAKRDDEGKGLSHAAWMLEGIEKGYIQHEKAHRWLGYIQGLMVTNGVVTLKDVKSINVRSGKG